MRLLTTAAWFAAVTGGPALAQPAGTTDAQPAVPAPGSPAPVATAPTELPPSPPAVTQPPLAPPASPLVPPASRLVPPASPLAPPASPPAPPLTAPALTKPVPTAAAPTASQWYGWQVLIADGATLGFAFAIQQRNIALGWFGAGAAVHATHGHYGRALASVALRVALPVLGAAAGAATVSGCTGDFCNLGPGLVGAALGLGAAEIIDLVIATDEREIAPRKPLSNSWTPVASAGRSGATLGIAARF